MSEHVDGGITFDATIRREAIMDVLMTSYARLAVDELGFGCEVRSYSDTPNSVGAYADAAAEWEFANPAELESLAEFFRTKMPQALRTLAATWRQQIADGMIPAPAEGAD